MKILLVYDLAVTSTRDVADGVRDGLRELGHEVIPVPIHQYAHLMFAPWRDLTPDKVPEHARAMIYGAINKLILSEAIIHRPALLYVVTGWTVSVFAVEQIKQAIPIRTLLHLTESPYMDEEQAAMVGPWYDAVLTNERTTVRAWQRQHDNVAYMPHSYNPNVHSPAPIEQDIDVFFCATGFEERMQMIGGIDWTGVKLYLAGLWPNPERYGIPKHAVHEGQIHNRDLPTFYRRARICLNQHRTSKAWCEEVASGDSTQQQYIAHAESLGPRVFEVMACGAFLLTDWREELDALGLRDGEHLAIYRSPEELAEKVWYYLAHTAERERIALRGMEAIRDCRFSSRLQSIVMPQFQEQEVSV